MRQWSRLPLRRSPWALGARRTELARAFAVQGLGLALVGIAAGIALAVPATRAFASLLFGVNPLDLWTFAVVSLGSSRPL